ncbi:Rtr1/RPAP2 family-domain-containing protein [Scheffersomyces xylosifermentans]|uniref:Rtr1/RPAP2 family-domain-containing protein n=1 Tax=Scheffersomyces xylosifermentans TaxID=1304137 RepID=UPI00315DCD65
MEILQIDHFVSRISGFANKDLLTPPEASRLSLVITELLVDYYVDLPLLKFLSRFLTQQAYDEIIEERNIEHQCGYILCPKSPKQSVRRLSNNSNATVPASLKEPGAATRFQIYNRKPSMVLPNTYLSQYCCKDHYRASIFYRNQLSNEALFARKDIMVIQPFPELQPGYSNWYENGITCLEEVLAKHKELKEHGKTLSEVIAMMNGLNIGENEMSHETSQLIKLIEDFEIVEKEGGERGDINEEEDEDNQFDEYHREEMSNNVEGYITSGTSFGGYVV